MIKLLKVFPELYFVGGYCRDILIKNHSVVTSLRSSDIDFATPLLPTEVMVRAKQFGLTVVPTGIEHGTVTVFEGGIGYEITTFRKDVSCDGRNATVEFSKNIKDDLNRRDFTINAIAFNEHRAYTANEYCYDDIYDKIIRTVGDPFTRFREDYLRIIRMARFAAKLNFTIEEKTYEAAKDLAPLVMTYVSAERIFMEFEKMFSYDFGVGKFIRILHDIGLFTRIFPEFDGFDKMKQDPKYHPEGNVSEHVFQVVDKIDKKYRWHGLLHDVGKPFVYKKTDGHYSGHADIGAWLIENDIAPRLRFPNSLTDSVKETTRHHMYATDLSDNGAITEAMCRRFQSKTMHCFEAIEAVAKADKGDRFGEIAAMFVPLPVKIKPVLMGRHLIEIGMNPGPEIGNVLKKVYDYQIETGIDDLEKLIERAKNEQVD